MGLQAYGSSVVPVEIHKNPNQDLRCIKEVLVHNWTTIKPNSTEELGRLLVGAVMRQRRYNVIYGSWITKIVACRIAACILDDTNNGQSLKYRQLECFACHRRTTRHRSDRCDPPIFPVTFALNMVIAAGAVMYGAFKIHTQLLSQAAPSKSRKSVV